MRCLATECRKFSRGAPWARRALPGNLCRTRANRKPDVAPGARCRSGGRGGTGAPRDGAKPVARRRVIWQADAMRLISVALAALLAGPAFAEMSAEEFDAYTRGQTFYYGAEGEEPYGAEEYLPGQRVRWSFLDGECQ